MAGLENCDPVQRAAYHLLVWTWSTLRVSVAVCLRREPQHVMIQWWIPVLVHSWKCSPPVLRDLTRNGLGDFSSLSPVCISCWLSDDWWWWSSVKSLSLTLHTESVISRLSGTCCISLLLRTPSLLAASGLPLSCRTWRSSSVNHLVVDWSKHVTFINADDAWKVLLLNVLFDSEQFVHFETDSRKLSKLDCSVSTGDSSGSTFKTAKWEHLFSFSQATGTKHSELLIKALHCEAPCMIWGLPQNVIYLLILCGESDRTYRKYRAFTTTPLWTWLLTIRALPSRVLTWLYAPSIWL